MCCGGGWGDRRGTRDREEQVNYDIGKTAQQDEASYDNKVKRDQDHSRGQRKRRDEAMEGKTTSIVKKGLEMRRVVLGTVVPHYITVVNQRQNVRLEVKYQERSRKKPGKTPEEVHTMRHFGKNMVDVVRPSQTVIYEDTKKLETGDLLNFRTRQVDVEGWWINSGSWGTDEHTLGLVSIELQPIVGHPVIGKVKTRLK